MHDIYLIQKYIKGYRYENYHLQIKEPNGPVFTTWNRPQDGIKT